MALQRARTPVPQMGRSPHVRAGIVASAALNRPALRRLSRRIRRRQATPHPRGRRRPTATGAVAPGAPEPGRHSHVHSCHPVVRAGV